MLHELTMVPFQIRKFRLNRGFADELHVASRRVELGRKKGENGGALGERQLIDPRLETGAVGWHLRRVTHR